MKNAYEPIEITKVLPRRRLKEAIGLLTGGRFGGKYTVDEIKDMSDEIINDLSNHTSNYKRKLINSQEYVLEFYNDKQNFNSLDEAKRFLNNGTKIKSIKNQFHTIDEMLNGELIVRFDELEGSGGFWSINPMRYPAVFYLNIETKFAKEQFEEQLNLTKTAEGILSKHKVKHPSYDNGI